MRPRRSPRPSPPGITLGADHNDNWTVGRVGRGRTLAARGGAVPPGLDMTTANRNRIICGDWIERLKELPAGSVHCVVTSPPYWGQRLYWWGTETPCDPKKGQHHEWAIDRNGYTQTCKHCRAKAPTLGLEPTFQEHIQKLVEGFREVRRVLRDDGVMWINYGDKYYSPGGVGRNRYWDGREDEYGPGNRPDNDPSRNMPTMRPGNLIGLAWRLALALQEDGWILRSDVIWAKAVSFCETYSGSTMPESVNGTRWERCRVKIKGGDFIDRGNLLPGARRGADTGMSFDDMQKAGMFTQWSDCPGCEKCRDTGGYVLRKGSWRATRAHEYLFQFVKGPGYFSDAEAVREENLGIDTPIGRDNAAGIMSQRHQERQAQSGAAGRSYGVAYSNPSGRNLRDVFAINPQAYPEAHYATFPEALVEPLIKVSTSEKGCCPKCGAQWARVIETRQIKRERPSDRTARHEQGEGVNSCGNTVAGVDTQTLGWRPTCKCYGELDVPVVPLDVPRCPAVVLDPFGGSGTVGQVAARLGRDYILIELNPDYIEKQAKYRVAQGETGIPAGEQAGGQAAFDFSTVK